MSRLTLRWRPTVAVVSVVLCGAALVVSITDSRYSWAGNRAPGVRIAWAAAATVVALAGLAFTARRRRYGFTLTSASLLLFLVWCRVVLGSEQL